MLRTAARPANRGSRLSHYHLPAPLAGWNARDNVTAMEPMYAVAMENIFPEEGWIRRRSGWESFNSGSASNGNFNSLFELARGNTTSTLIGLTTTGRMYAGITSGALPAATSTALGGAEATAVNVNQRLVMAFDDNTTAVQDWDGTTLTATSLTGPTSTAMAHVSIHKNRTYLVEWNSLKFWYSGVDAYAGAYTAYDLQYIAKRGGFLLATSTMTLDGGDGVDDYFVAITSQGQAVVYQGSNPGDATNWALKGIYDIPKPIGRRCTVKYGGDLLVITETGVVSMLGLFAEGGRFRGQADFTNIVGPAWRELVTSTTKTHPGWFGVHFGALNMLVFNVPTHASNQTGYQFVMNVTTGAWCRWDMPMGHAVNFQSRWIFGYLTVTRKAEEGGGNDQGVTAVTSYFKQAYTNLGVPGRKKLIRRVIPHWGANADTIYYINLDADFNDSTFSATVLRTDDTWIDGMTIADQGLNVVTQPESHGSIGSYFSVRGALAQTGSQVGQHLNRYTGCDIFHEVGGHS